MAGLDAEDFRDLLVGASGVRVPGLAGLGVCGSTTVVVLALDDGNLGVVVVRRAIVFVDE